MMSGNVISQLEDKILRILYDQSNHYWSVLNPPTVKQLKRLIEADLKQNIGTRYYEAALQNLLTHDLLEYKQEVPGRVTVFITEEGKQKVNGHPNQPSAPSKGRHVLAKLIGTVVVVMTLSLILRSLIAADNPPPSSDRTPTALATATMPSMPEGSSCSVDDLNYADPNLSVGSNVRIVPGRGASVREGPGANRYTQKFVWTNLVDPGYPPDSAIVIKRYEQARITDDPVCVASIYNGERMIIWWHLVFPDGLQGWVAANDRDGPILQATTP